MKPQTLNISPDLALPLEAVTETFALLAKRGSGKTYTAKVLAEEMIGAGLPIAVVDPVGVWWGLRASADGKAPGLPVVVFGGDRADVPLEETSGQLLADVLIEERFPAIFDLSLLSKSAARRWMTDFAERLYRRNREPLHLFLDEADAWAPQRVDPGGQRLLGAIEDLVRRGRARGLGLTLITQRPAVLNKDVLTQTEVLVALKMTGVQDVRAIDEWVRLHADEGEAQTLKSSLPSLPVGTAWVWSPGWLGTLQKIQVRRAQTFDSSATPKAGQQRIEPRQLAEVDLEKLGERIAATLEKSKSERPVELQKQIAQLEKELRERPHEVQEVMREISVLGEGEVERLEAQAHDLIAVSKELHGLGTSILARLSNLSTASSVTSAAPPLAAPVEIPCQKQVPAPKPEKGNPKPDAITAPQRRILAALATFEALGLASVARSNVAIWADQSPTSSGYGNNLGALRSRGLIDYPSGGQLCLTHAGRAAAPPVEKALSLDELHRAWYVRLPRPQAAILQQLVRIYPQSIGRLTLAEVIGQSATSSGYGNNLGALRSLGLVDYPQKGEVAATSLLFPVGLK